MIATDVVYRYFRFDSDHDVSTRQLELSLDEVTWTAATAVEELPPACIAADAQEPPPAGFAGFWFRVLTGPGQMLQPVIGRNVFRGRLSDNPEILHPRWSVVID